MNLTDADGAVTKTYHYDAFGVERSISDADTNAFRYCGEYFDTETGTIYLRARYYNPIMGRFTQRDSYVGDNGNPLSLNLYTYCHNNPILYFDPKGNSIQLEGSVDEKNVMLSEMQKLMDHKIAYDKKGYVYISEYAYSYNPFFISPDGSKIPAVGQYANHLAGNQLIEGMIDNKNNCKMSISDDAVYGRSYGEDNKNAKIEFMGSDAVVLLQPVIFGEEANTPELYVQSRSGLLELEKTDSFLILAHEMIHADHIMRGIYKEGTYNHMFVSSISKGIPRYSYESISREEAATVGFISSGSVNENAIRKEQCRRPRGRYTIDAP